MAEADHRDLCLLEADLQALLGPLLMLTHARRAELLDLLRVSYDLDGDDGRRYPEDGHRGDQCSHDCSDNRMSHEASLLGLVSAARRRTPRLRGGGDGAE